MSDNLPAVPQKTALEIPVAEFEGEMVRAMLGKIPAINMEMPVGYARGTHLKVELELRVRSVRVEEDRRGDLTREHIFALEEIKLVGAYTADDLDPGVGGSASASAAQDDDDSDERSEEEASESEVSHGVDAGF